MNDILSTQLQKKSDNDSKEETPKEDETQDGPKE